jgi:hypothetical protein
MAQKLTERWDFVVHWSMGQILKENGPFYEYRDRPEEILPYKKAVTLTSSPTSDLQQNGQI